MRHSTLLAYANGLKRMRYRCESRLFGALDAYLELHPEAEARSGEGRRKLYSAMRFLVEEIGEEKCPEFIRWADGRMTARGMFVSSPRSYGWLIPLWRKEAKADDPERFLRQSLLTEEE